MPFFSSLSISLPIIITSEQLHVSLVDMSFLSPQCVFVCVCVCVCVCVYTYIGLSSAIVVKNLLANSGDAKDMGLIPGSGRSL